MKHYRGYYILGLVFLLGLWQGAAIVLGSEILLPGPGPVIRRLAALAFRGRFLRALFASLARLALSLAIAVPAGIALGLCSGLDRRAAAFFQPLFSLVSATPVMAMILIAYLWFGSERTPVFTAILVVLPIVAANVAEGVKAVDSELKDLFFVFALPRKAQIFSLYLPAIAPFIAGGLRSGLALCWKALIAAEVLVQPARALGTGMQDAKAHLETAELFAWTAAVIIAAALSEWALGALLKRRH
jgi:NitT/TauT family transport system permease protein